MYAKAMMTARVYSCVVAGMARTSETKASASITTTHDGPGAR